MQITSLAVLNCYPKLLASVISGARAGVFELDCGHVAEFNIKWRIKESLGTAACAEYLACS